MHGLGDIILLPQTALTVSIWFVIPCLGLTLFFPLSVSPSSQMTNDLLLLLLSRNSFVGVNAVLISHLVLNDAKSRALKSLYPGIR